MITAVILSALGAMVMYLITNVMPDMSLITLTDQFVGIVDLFSYAFYFIPLPTFLLCLGIVVMVQNAELAWNIFNWLLRRIPGQG